MEPRQNPYSEKYSYGERDLSQKPLNTTPLDEMMKRKPVPISDEKARVENKDDYQDDFDVDFYYTEDVIPQPTVHRSPGLLLDTSTSYFPRAPPRTYPSSVQLQPSSAGPSISRAASSTSLASVYLSSIPSPSTPPNLPARTYSSPEKVQPSKDTPLIPLNQSPSPSPSNSRLRDGSSLYLSPSVETPQTQSSSFAQKAFRDARHFAGGILRRPFESTKHFTIVRHSHGLVFYQGASTSLAITIFSDAPLPAERTLWLQSKGWSGATGMKIKGLLGNNGGWIDVTPRTLALAEQVNPSDERAWQRDIKTFQTKGPTKQRERHLVRETAVVQIPEDAGDGYFQIVMCVGDKKKVLCPSPVFRVLSTSRSPHVLKGASLTTLPLELGAMVGGLALNLYAKNTIGRATAVATPVTKVAQGSVAKFMPKFWTQQVASTVTGIAKEHINATVLAGNQLYHENRAQSYITVKDVEAELEEGPKAPYPVRIIGRSQHDVSNMIEELDMPNFGLIDVPDTALQQLHGYYFGWARPYNKKTKEEIPWCQAIISVTLPDTTQLARINVGHVPKKIIALRLMSDFENLLIDHNKFEVQLMGYIRPDEPAQRAQLEKGVQEGNQSAIDAAIISEYNDVSLAQQMLDHPAWSVERAMRPELKERKSSGLQKLSESYSSTRLAAQRQLDRVPLHRVGVRLEAGQVHTKTLVVTGYYMVR